MTDIITKEDALSQSLRQKGFYCAALVHELRESGMGIYSRDMLFMEDELIRLGDFLILCHSFHFLPFVDDDEYPDRKSKSYSVTIPLLRVILESFFRIRFLYSELIKNNTYNQELTYSKLDLLVSNLKKEYEVYIREDADIAPVNLPALSDSGGRDEARRNKKASERCY